MGTKPAKKPRGPARCRDCQQPITFWRSTEREGSWLCVDLSPDDNGTVIKIPTPAAVYGRRLSGVDLAAAACDGELLFTIHATTCSARRDPVSGRRPPNLSAS